MFVKILKKYSYIQWNGYKNPKVQVDLNQVVDFNQNDVECYDEAAAEVNLNRKFFKWKTIKLKSLLDALLCNTDFFYQTIDILLYILVLHPVKPKKLFRYIKELKHI